MKSGKVRSGLVKFERSPVSDNEPVVSGKGLSTPTDQSHERVLGSIEEFAEFRGS